MTDDHEIKWELDGGNYSKTDEAVLFAGRLYANRTELLFARATSETKGIVKILTGLILYVLSLTSSRS